MAGKKHDSRYRKLEFENGRLTFVWHGVKYYAEKSPPAPVPTQLRKGDLVELAEGSTPEKPVVCCEARGITEGSPWKMAGVLKKGVGTGPVSEAEKKKVLEGWEGSAKKKDTAGEGKGELDPVSAAAQELQAESEEGSLYSFDTLESFTSFKVAAIRAGKRIIDFPEKLAVFVRC